VILRRLWLGEILDKEKSFGKFLGRRTKMIKGLVKETAREKNSKVTGAKQLKRRILEMEGGLSQEDQER